MKREFSVSVPGKLSQIIKADYMAVQGGHLCFRNQNPGTYPDTVRVFAPGAWLEVEALTEPQRPEIAGPPPKPFREIDLDDLDESCGYRQ